MLLAALTPIDGLPFVADVGVNQVGRFGTNASVSGRFRSDVSQIQMTATKVLGPFFGANTGIVLVELGLQYVHDLPNRGKLRLDGPATFTSGNPFHSTPPGAVTAAGGAHPLKAFEESGRFPSETSWGYRVAAQLEYNNAIGPWNLLPRLQWQHDVDGISPSPGGPFLEDRTAISVGLRATYLQQWEIDVSWTAFLGAGRHNLSNDRDFVAATLKYSL